MTRELMSDTMPIESGPIVIDYDGRTSPDGLYIDFDTFIYASLSSSRGRAIGEWAHEIATATIIDELELPILPPATRSRTTEGHVWGPFPHKDYFIAPRSYVDMYAHIVQNTIQTKRSDDLLGVLDQVNLHAVDLTHQITDSIDVPDLPGAFQSYLGLPELLKSGDIVSFADFQLTGRQLNTSPGKYSEVFDTVVALLGNDSAQQLLAELAAYAHPQSRKQIREELYISTQGLADLLQEVRDNPSNFPQFNPRSREILIAVLGTDPLD